MHTSIREFYHTSERDMYAEYLAGGAALPLESWLDARYHAIIIAKQGDDRVAENKPDFAPLARRILRHMAA